MEADGGDEGAGFDPDGNAGANSRRIALPRWNGKSSLLLDQSVGLHAGREKWPSFSFRRNREKLLNVRQIRFLAAHLGEDREVWRRQ